MIGTIDVTIGETVTEGGGQEAGVRDVTDVEVDLETDPTAGQTDEILEETVEAHRDTEDKTNPNKNCHNLVSMKNLEKLNTQKPTNNYNIKLQNCPLKNFSFTHLKSTSKIQNI